MNRRYMPTWALPRLSTVAPVIGESFARARARVGGFGRARALSEARLSAIGRDGGKASAAALSAKERKAKASMAGRLGNAVRWGAR